MTEETQSPGTKHREWFWGTGQAFFFWNRRKSTKDMCQDWGREEKK